jgi:hypothetical protein
MVLLCSDLLGDSLTPAERKLVAGALQRADGRVDDAISTLPDDVASKVSCLMSKGMGLASELRKLSQQGVVVLFGNETTFVRVTDFFEIEPVMLFSVGNVSLLLSEGVGVHTSLADCEAAGGHGVLVADRPLGDLLRVPSVIDALGESRLLVISDVYRSAAHLFHADASAQPEAAAQNPTSETSLPPSARKVFISGSRSQTEIPPIIQTSLEAIASRGFGILIGDSNAGVDGEIIDYLRVPLYRNVCVYTVGKKPRIKVESEWDVCCVQVDESLKGQKRQMAKDRVMGDSADWGLAVFRPLEKTRFGSVRVSAGTLRNSIQLLLAKKPVKFFYVYEGSMCVRNLKTIDDLEEVIATYANERVSDADRDMILTAKGAPATDDVAGAKHKKIYDKYRSLLKEERRVAQGNGGGSGDASDQSQMSFSL